MEDNDLNDMLSRNPSLVPQAPLPNLPGIHQLPSITSGVGPTGQISTTQPIFSTDSQFSLWGIGSNQLLPGTSGGLLGLSSLSASALSSIPSVPMHPPLLMSGYPNYSAIDQYSNALSNGFNASNNQIVTSVSTQDPNNQVNDQLKRLKTKQIIKQSRNIRPRPADEIQNKTIDDLRQQEKRQRNDSFSLPDKRNDNSNITKIPEQDRRYLERTPAKSSWESFIPRQPQFEDFGTIVEPDIPFHNIQTLKDMYNNQYQELKKETKTSTKNIWEIIPPVAIEILCPALLSTYFSVQEQEDEFGIKSVTELAASTHNDIGKKIELLILRANTLDNMMKTELARSEAISRFSTLKAVDVINTFQAPNIILDKTNAKPKIYLDYVPQDKRAYVKQNGYTYDPKTYSWFTTDEDNELIKEFNTKFLKQKENKARHIEYLDYAFKTMKGSNEDKVKLFYNSKLEKKRLNKKLKELKIAIYEVSTTTHFPRKNKYGNFSEAYYKGKEIMF
eukprot:gene11592-24266_t